MMGQHKLLGKWSPCTAEAGGGNTVAIPQSVADCMQMYSDPDIQCKCIVKLCLAGIIPAEECGSNPSCN